MKDRQFSHMVNKHTSELRKFAMKYTNNHHDAKDLMQDTMLKALKYYEQFEEGTNIRGWLFTIMRNTFINNFRRDTRTNRLMSQETDTDALQPALIFMDNSSENKIVREDITKALKNLSQHHSIAFIRFFEGYKYREIASELDIPIGTVKTRIHEARRLLKKGLHVYRNGNR